MVRLTANGSYYCHHTTSFPPCYNELFSHINKTYIIVNCFQNHCLLMCGYSLALTFSNILLRCLFSISFMKNPSVTPVVENDGTFHLWFDLLILHIQTCSEKYFKFFHFQFIMRHADTCFKTVTSRIVSNQHDSYRQTQSTVKVLKNLENLDKKACSSKCFIQTSRSLCCF